mgnify:CR=1 FL=1
MRFGEVQKPHYNTQNNFYTQKPESQVTSFLTFKKLNSTANLTFLNSHAPSLHSINGEAKEVLVHHPSPESGQYITAGYKKIYESPRGEKNLTR